MDKTSRKGITISFQLPDGNPAQPDRVKRQIETVLEGEAFASLLARGVKQEQHLLAGPDPRRCSLKTGCTADSGGKVSCTVELVCEL